MLYSYWGDFVDKQNKYAKTYSVAREISNEDKMKFLNDIKADKHYFENKNVYIMFAASIVFAWLTLVKPEGAYLNNFLEIRSISILWWKVGIILMFLLMIINIFSMIPSLNRKSTSNSYYRSVAKRGLAPVRHNKLDFAVVAAARTVLFKERLFRIQLMIITLTVYLIIDCSNPWDRSVIENVIGIAIIAPVMFFCIVGRGPIVFFKMLLSGNDHVFSIEDNDIEDYLDIES